MRYNSSNSTAFNETRPNLGPDASTASAITNIHSEVKSWYLDSLLLSLSLPSIRVAAGDPVRLQKPAQDARKPGNMEGGAHGRRLRQKPEAA